MRVLTCFFVILSFQYALGSKGQFKSFLCPQNIFTHKGISCCLDDVDQATCTRIIDSQLEASTIERIKEYKNAFVEGAFPFGNGPNCHWNTLAHLRPSIPTAYVDENRLDRELSSTRKLVEHSELLAGDVIAFVLNGEIRDQITINFVPTNRWTPFEQLEHSAIYLGDGVVFQKENTGTDYFTISSLERARRAYEKAATRDPHIRGKMIIEAWR